MHSLHERPELPELYIAILNGSLCVLLKPGGLLSLSLDGELGSS